MPYFPPSPSAPNLAKSAPAERATFRFDPYVAHALRIVRDPTVAEDPVAESLRRGEPIELRLMPFAALMTLVSYKVGESRWEMVPWIFPANSDQMPPRNIGDARLYSPTPLLVQIVGLGGEVEVERTYTLDGRFAFQVDQRAQLMSYATYKRE